MKAMYVNSLKEGMSVDSIFALRTKELRATRAREAYLSMEIADRTGRIAAVMFRPDRAAEAVPTGSIVRIRGVVTTYRGILRVSVDALAPVSEYAASDLLPSGPRDIQELVAELRTLVRSVKNPGLSNLLRAVFGDKRFFRVFKECPAAQTYHHAYVGGLLEHTVSVATMCVCLAGLYPEVDRDLLVAGALLHDIGKVDELAFGTSIEYTDAGRLLGHVTLGERRVRAAIATIGDVVSAELELQLSHVMISHHGELEWGAPKRPSTLEALILHHADNMDAKTAGFVVAAKAASLVEEPWTDAMNLFRRPLYAPRAVEDDRVMYDAEEECALRRGA
ncbi:MAG: HD domain-containing protein [Actinobacteria bacterium]|nr:MAG: HD domain-containing protein [Actinomycetota bacterium]